MKIFNYACNGEINLVIDFFFLVESGGRKLNENKALTSKKARLVLKTDFG